MGTTDSHSCSFRLDQHYRLVRRFISDFYSAEITVVEHKVTKEQLALRESVLQFNAAAVAQHIKRFVEVHESFVDNYVPTSGDVMTMVAASRNGGAFGLHFGAFVPTILARASLLTPYLFALLVYPYPHRRIMVRGSWVLFPKPPCVCVRTPSLLVTGKCRAWLCIRFISFGLRRPRPVALLATNVLTKSATNC